ncbi:hypothetical protein FRC10_003779 [Ceratobasidium sp. 414]|nr:hypothetical protein FRC10_003779 [Ceratobasidium sp. 414]
MAGRAKPKLVRSYDLSRRKHELLLSAVKLYTEEQKKPCGQKRQSARKVAQKITDEYKIKTGIQIPICYTTILRIYAGGESLFEFNKSKAWLNQIEEDCVVEFLVHTAARGFPLTHRHLKEIVDSIIQKCIPDFKGVRKRYTGRLLARNTHRISTYWGNPLDRCCAQAVNPTTVHAWFQLIEDLVTKHSIAWFNIWGADETGVVLGVGGTERVLGGAGQKGQHRSCSGSRENVTVMVTIGACGRSIPPFVVFKGQAFAVKWLQNNPVDAILSYSKKDWMTGEVSIEWLKHHDNKTSAQAGRGTWLLLVDGHLSHYPLELLNYARGHKIELACYPSHTTHVLQGLDDSTGFSITKDIFLTPFSQAYVETFTTNTIKSAFSATGIYPFNPNMIPAVAMAPSLPTSTRSSLPIELPDAVAAIASLWDMSPKELAGEGESDDEGDGSGNRDDDGDGGEEGDSEGEGNGESGDEGEGGDEGVGGDKGKGDDKGKDEGWGEGDDEGSGVAELQPTNMLHLEHGTEDTNARRSTPAIAHPPGGLDTILANTPAAFLVKDSPITSNDHLEPLPFHHAIPLPCQLSLPGGFGEPTTELEKYLFAQLQQYHARDKEMQTAYRGAHAQLALADRHCSQLQTQLQAKEECANKRKAGDGGGRLLGDGMPRALCNSDFYKRVKQLHDDATAKEAAKKQKALDNVETKRLKDAWNEEEKARKALNAEAHRQWKEGPLAAWTAAQKQAKDEGRCLVCWPKPKAPVKLKALLQLWKVQEEAVAATEEAEMGVVGEGTDESDSDSVGSDE